MRSMPQALIWETVARSWWLLVGFTLLSNLIPLLVYAELLKLKLDTLDPAFILLQLAFVPMVLIQLVIGILIAQGRASRLYALPISTSSIVAWHVVSGAVLLAISIAFISSLNNWLFNVNWPVVNMALLAIAVWSATQLLVSSSTHQSLPGTTLAGLPITLLLFWLPTRFGVWRSAPKHYWTELSMVDVIFLFSVTAICWALTNYTTSRARCGERFAVIGFFNWLEKQWDAWAKSTVAPPRFRSPAAAQFWYEWRLKGMVFPFTFSVVLAISALACLQTWLQNDYSLEIAYEGIFTVAVFMILLAIAGGFFLGMDIDSTPTGQRETQLGDAVDSERFDVMGSFQASRPFESRAFARVLLKVAATGFGIVLTMWLAAVVVVLGLMWLSGQMPQELLPVENPSVYSACILIGPWIAIANTIAAGQFALRRPTIFTAAVILFVLYLVGAAMMTNNVSPKVQTLVHSLVIGILSLGMLALTVWAFWWAARLKYVSMRELFGLVTIAIAVLIASVSICPVDVPAVTYLAIPAVAALVVLPFALLPIVIAKNRNR